MKSGEIGLLRFQWEKDQKMIVDERGIEIQE